MSKSMFTSPRSIRKNLIGADNVLQGPFGAKPIVYADSTASGKALAFVEDYIRDCVLPFYANTHTEASATGRQTSLYREDARTAIRQALNAPKQEYAIIFVGSGSTGAMIKLANVLGISPLAPVVQDPAQRGVVFISAQEHHSNELLWRESGNVDCVVIPQDPATGLLDQPALETKLRQYEARPLKLASLSAASNVTGIRCDTYRVTKLLQDYGFIAAWDFAAAGPHVGIDLTAHTMDAIYLSPHKYVGAPGTPGLLVARRSLFENSVPTVPGGGTVTFVQPPTLNDDTTVNQHYIEDIESREEGGTPAIVESIRCGLAIQLHHQVGADWIEQQESYYLEKAMKVWMKNPSIVLLGNPNAKRVSIVSFIIKSPTVPTNTGTDMPTFLHYNFVVALLNDLFGIQSRGGCSCAMPYGHLLLNVDPAHSNKIFQKMKTWGTEAIKPGWTRLSFSYYMTLDTVNYIIAAVDLVAREGYKLLPYYQLNAKTGAWMHTSRSSCGEAKGLWDFSAPYTKALTVSKKDLKGCFQKAKKTLALCPVPHIQPVSEAFLSTEVLPPRGQMNEDREVTWFVVAAAQQELQTQPSRRKRKDNQFLAGKFDSLVHVKKISLSFSWRKMTSK